MSPPSTSTPICIFQAWMDSKGCPGAASALGVVKPPEVPTGHHLGLSRSLRVQPAPLSLVSPANLLKVHSLPSSLSLTKIVNSSCTSVIPGSPFPFGWDSTGVLGRVWPAGQGGDPAPLPCPREAVLHSTTQERQGAAGEGQGGHKDDSESGACLLMRRDCRSLA